MFAVERGYIPVREENSEFKYEVVHIRPESEVVFVFSLLRSLLRSGKSKLFSR